MKQSKTLSIITNFGCHYKCPYCIVKRNNLQIPKTTLKGLDQLTKYFTKYGIEDVSLSGGGDPLYQYEQHKDWYDIFFKTMYKWNINKSLHTSYIGLDDFPYYSFDKVVYHINPSTDISKIKRHNVKTVRVVVVVTVEVTKEVIDRIAKDVKNNPDIDQLTFRELVNSNYTSVVYADTYTYLLKGDGEKWKYVSQDDYNLYYAEGKVSDTFEDFKNNNNKQFNYGIYR